MHPSLPIEKKPLARYWLLVGVAALAIAGLYSLVLAGGRSPKLGESALLGRLFHDALVVHVDLSVLVWFLAMACLMWSRACAHVRPIIPYTEHAALIAFALGTLAITLSPLDPNGEALMSNYIPVIHSPAFFFGLMLIGCGTLLMACRMLFTAAPFSLSSAALITLAALAAFAWSYHQMPNVIDGQQYYELLFWGGGHILQFTHVQILMVCWLLLSGIQRPFKILFYFGPACALIGLASYMFYDVASAEHRTFFTHLMIWGNGIAPLLCLWFIAPALWRARAKTASCSALVMSILLFLYGGLLGTLIHGQNVVIPAHYHGSIVGITLAFMGAAYALLTELGYRDVSRFRLAFWQPIIYGVGQIMHVTGFAWSGGYGALRKTPGGDYEGAAQIAMGLMGGGAGLAAIGGLMFVIVIMREMFRKSMAN